MILPIDIFVFEMYNNDNTDKRNDKAKGSFVNGFSESSRLV